jgi:hypothetical protein
MGSDIPSFVVVVLALIVVLVPVGFSLLSLRPWATMVLSAVTTAVVIGVAVILSSAGNPEEMMWAPIMALTAAALTSPLWLTSSIVIPVLLRRVRMRWGDTHAGGTGLPSQGTKQGVVSPENGAVTRQEAGRPENPNARLRKILSER